MSYASTGHKSEEGSNGMGKGGDKDGSKLTVLCHWDGHWCGLYRILGHALSVIAMKQSDTNLP